MTDDPDPELRVDEIIEQLGAAGWLGVSDKAAIEFVRDDLGWEAVVTEPGGVPRAIIVDVIGDVPALARRDAEKRLPPPDLSDGAMFLARIADRMYNLAIWIPVDPGDLPAIAQQRGTSPEKDLLRKAIWHEAPDDAAMMVHFERDAAEALRVTARTVRRWVASVEKASKPRAPRWSSGDVHEPPRPDL